MMQLAVVTRGTLCCRLVVDRHAGGILIGSDVLAALGLTDGDAVELHSDGRMLVIVPPAKPAEVPPA